MRFSAEPVTDPGSPAYLHTDGGEGTETPQEDCYAG
ncbi:MAG: hypothetical protein BWX48_00614 [Verrucomicrobia bacterium ADurb.Bin006]|nr:MAG: hypothetical protein BWX48_00614 [Verrucomicrobia bacterium ADurb.Bin006]